jgi:hypothetical protein
MSSIVTSSIVVTGDAEYAAKDEPSKGTAGAPQTTQERYRDVTYIDNKDKRRIRFNTESARLRTSFDKLCLCTDVIGTLYLSRSASLQRELKVDCRPEVEVPRPCKASENICQIKNFGEVVAQNMEAIMRFERDW